MNQSNYFDVVDVWMNELIGSEWLFFGIGLVLIWMVCAKAKMGTKPSIMFSVIWGGICFSIASGTYMLVWALITLAVAVIFFNNISKILR